MVPSPTPAGNRSVLSTVDADTDELLRALAEPRRRYALTALHERGGRLSLEALANHVVAMECDCDEDDSSSVVERTVVVALYHTHAPLLAKVGLVDFDADEKTVALTDLGRDVQPLDS